MYTTSTHTHRQMRIRVVCFFGGGRKTLTTEHCVKTYYYTSETHFTFCAISWETRGFSKADGDGGTEGMQHKSIQNSSVLCCVVLCVRDVFVSVLCTTQWLNIKASNNPDKLNWKTLKRNLSDETRKRRQQRSVGW